MKLHCKQVIKRAHGISNPATKLPSPYSPLGDQVKDPPEVSQMLLPGLAEDDDRTDEKVLLDRLLGWL